jgi:quercetin dioxygenase-like cupin family protein
MTTENNFSSFKNSIMQPIKKAFAFFAAISILWLVSCNESATTSDNKDTDTTAIATNNDASSRPAYDPALEPLTVGAKFSKKLADTLSIKMYEFTLKPGDSAALHAHPDHTVYVLQGGQLAVTFNGTDRQIMDLKTGTGFVSGSLSDAGKNIGNTTIKLLVTDIYRPRTK